MNKPIIEFVCYYCNSAFIPSATTRWVVKKNPTRKRYCSKSCHYKAGHRSENERFWEKVNKTNSCWLWKAKNNGRYGVFYVKGIGFQYAHRVSWRMANNQEIPKGMDVCHHCDVPLCIRPHHLFIGTRKDNMQDASKKGRIKPTRGEKNPFAKLTPEKVIEIVRRRNTGEFYKIIAQDFHVGITTCREICDGKKWKHITGLGISSPPKHN